MFLLEAMLDLPEPLSGPSEAYTSYEVDQLNKLVIRGYIHTEMVLTHQDDVFDYDTTFYVLTPRGRLALECYAAVHTSYM